MKELSIEQKAKAYDELLVKAQELTEDGYIDPMALHDMFPQLKESEDEKIKKEIVDFICWATDRGSITSEQREKYNSWLAWLEKQGEIWENIKHIEAMLDCQTCVNYKNECYPDRNIFKCPYPIKCNGENPELSENKITEKELYNRPKYEPGDWIQCYNHEPVQIIGLQNGMYSFSNGDIRPIHMVDNNPNEHFYEKEMANTEQSVSELDKEYNVSDEYRKGFEGGKQYVEKYPQEFNLQPKQEWSKEDEEHIKFLCALLLGIKSKLTEYGKEYQAEVDWLKSLQERYAWKPSEEQLKEGLDEAAHDWDIHASVNPISMIMDRGRPIGTYEHITSHADSFKKGVEWIINKLKAL